MRKNLKITEKAHSIIKKYCDDRHLKMGDWISDAIISLIEKENEKTNPTRKNKNM